MVSFNANLAFNHHVFQKILFITYLNAVFSGAAPITIGASAADDEIGMPIIDKILKGYPGGSTTPLCYHVNEVIKQITDIAPQLRAAGKKASVIIFTDGTATDGDIATALQPLHLLPAWVVIRMCTDDSAITTYWEAIDAQLELDMDVIDDPLSEAEDIKIYNDWLTYGTPLHRLREFGITVKEIDMINETKLGAQQVKNVCAYM